MRVLKKGRQEFGPESWTDFAVYQAEPGSLPIEAGDDAYNDILDEIERRTGHAWYGGTYGGPGRAFCEAPFVQWNKRGRILVTRQGGLDI
jgi:hypothetical protein